MQRQLAEIQTEISNRDQRIKDLEHQLAQLRQTKAATCVEERVDKGDEGSDAKGKMIPSSKFTGLKEKYLEATEKLVKAEEKVVESEEMLAKFKEKYKKKRRELMDKLEDRQKQFEGAREVPPTTSSIVSDQPTSDNSPSLNSAVHEVAHLRAAVTERDNQIASLKTQVESLKVTAAEHCELEERNKQPNKTVVDWRKKFEAAKVSTLANKILDSGILP